ncbi:STAS/SEC14 domain-containing protein [Ramlibacter sp. WS9]|uniref:STAS/SEC14 domain-containing protein n=1 Tax=Ramlibacter sp. WS9 TaxID=1882741 RepID=UPI0011448D8A|nr:STAS/SEC14 domain-containing protein [Ramlibacter sp. WS9]ROZ74432.1 STAS/SEC14 domain-containing protein [Ramlibacter sp. WS9]
MLQFQLQPKDGFVLVQLTGLVTPEAWENALTEVEAALHNEPTDRAVFELGGLVGWLGEPERRAVGVLMAKHLARMKRVALVIEARKITGVVEDEATRAGLSLRLFSVMDDAVRWVRS